MLNDRLKMAEEKYRDGQEKRYAILSNATIKMFAESVGIPISDEVAFLLAEDTTYRLREITKTSCQFMRHAKRKRMTTEDFNKAMKMSDNEPVLGHNNTNPVHYKTVRDSDIVFRDDKYTDLAAVALEDEVTLSNPGKTTIKAHWLAVEGIQKPQTAAEKLANIRDEHRAYYENVAKAVLGNNLGLMKHALTDLRCNPNIGPALANFVCFIQKGLWSLKHDTHQMTKLLHTVRALLSNKYLFLEPRPYLDILLQSITLCLVDPLIGKNSKSVVGDHWMLRDYAARLLSFIVRKWSSSLNQLKQVNSRTLNEVLSDPTKPFCCHYGAVMGLIAFGNKAVEEILLPHLPVYFPRLQAAMEDITNPPTKADAYKVNGAILCAAELIYRSRSHHLIQVDDVPHRLSSDAPPKLATSSSEASDVKLSTNQQMAPNSHKELLDMYNQMYGYFGDSLSMRLPLQYIRYFYAPQREDTLLTFGDVESRKSGDELLSNFLKAGQTSDENEENQSERSSRSERSHSDESCYDNMKATVSDTSQGIKLTISKKHRKLSNREKQSGIVSWQSKRAKRSEENQILHLDQTFERVPLSKKASFTFRYAGTIQKTQPRRRDSLLTVPILSPTVIKTESPVYAPPPSSPFVGKIFRKQPTARLTPTTFYVLSYVL